MEERKMGIIKEEQIRGSRDSSTGQIYCADCMPNVDTLKQEDIITGQEMESNDEDLYFCDNCGKRL